MLVVGKLLLQRLSDEIISDARQEKTDAPQSDADHHGDQQDGEDEEVEGEHGTVVHVERQGAEMLSLHHGLNVVLEATNGEERKQRFGRVLFSLNGGKNRIMNQYSTLS